MEGKIAEVRRTKDYKHKYNRKSLERQAHTHNVDAFVLLMHYLALSSPCQSQNTLVYESDTWVLC